MSFGEVITRDRQVIPRWHTYPMARWLGVTNATENAKPQASLYEDYSEITRSWESDRKLARAADLVGNALVLNHFQNPPATDAAQFVLDKKEKASILLIELAETYLRLSRKEQFPLPDVILPEEIRCIHGAIAELKTRTRQYPRNPILWMDLGFYYSAIGQNRAAAQAIKVALSLNQENRYLLLSASRFFMHIDSPDTALYYLRKSDTGQYDPWLVAAEIAISDAAESSSQRLKVGKSLLGEQNIPKFHLSELASALGTIELKEGSRKKGNKLLSLALEEPTENALAQVAFLQNAFGTPQTNVTANRSAQSFEADSRLKFHAQDFRGAVEACKQWFAYQPFSSQPAVFGSYIAAVALCDFTEAIKIARMGQISSPDEFMLKNNLAFSLASLGDTEKAQQTIASIVESDLDESVKNVIAATKGTIAFRSGRTEEGRQLYRNAVEFFKKQKDFRSEATAKYFWSREEKRIKGPTAMALEKEALADAKKHDLKELLQDSDMK